jgi:VCBS repeat-containing protein
MRRALVVAVLTCGLAVGAVSALADEPEDQASGHHHAATAAKTAPQATGGKRRSVRHPGPNNPTARNDSYAVPRGGTLVRNAAAGVLANDSELQGKPLTAILETTTAHGTLALSADGGFRYVNDSGAATSDSFTYRASNGTTQSSAATVTISISGPPPQAVNDAFPVTVDTPLTVPAPGVRAKDSVKGAAFASYGAKGTEQTTTGNATATTLGGSVSLGADGRVAYNPAGGFTGSDAFKYVLSSASGSSTAQVDLTVVPHAPVAVDDAFNTAQNTPLNQGAPGVLANDSLNTGAIASFGATTGTEQSTLGATTATAHGNVRLNADGSFTYTPSNGFNGADSFRYTVVNAGGTASALVSITVQASSAPDFIVTSPGFFFQFSGVSGQDPLLTLTRGRTYRFQVNTSSIHPFEILEAPPGSVSNNNISQGILTFTVPNTASTYRYHCSIHDFGNTIETAP